MKVVTEHKLHPKDPAVLELPSSGKILNVYPTPDGPTLIVESDPEDEETESVEVWTRLSGSPLPEDKELSYIGSFHAINTQDENAKPVLFHVYQTCSKLYE